MNTSCRPRLKGVTFLMGWVLCAVLNAQDYPRKVPDTVFLNGKIATVNRNFEMVEALAVSDGRITAVGSSREIRGLADADTQVIDLDGRTALPGFNDNHIHIRVGSAGTSRGKDWRAIDSLEGLGEALRAEAETLPTGEWIKAVLTRPSFPNDIAPDRHWLDRRVPYHPVALVRGHLMLLNSLALEKTGISRSMPDPKGGWIIRDESGEPTGHLFEDPAKRLVTKHFPAPAPMGDEQALDDLRRLFQGLTHLGYTSFNIPGLRPWDLRLVQEAYRRWGEEFPRVTIQIRLYPGYDEHDDLEEGIREAIEQLEGLGFNTGFGNDRIKIGAVKMSVDGGLSAPTFWTKVPYDNKTGWRKGKPDFYGVVRIPEPVLYAVARRAHELGWQLGIHTIGDAAVEMAVNVIERVLKEVPRQDPRPFLHHVSVMPPEETLKKMAALDIQVASQPAFVYWLGPFAVEALEGVREQTNNPQKSLLRHGIRLSYGTDGAPTDPRVELWSAVTRKGWDGKVYGPGEKVSLEEAIRAITMGTAYMNYDETKKGSLEVGKYADLVVLGEDIFTIDPDRIKGIPVSMTVVGGKVVYRGE